MVLFGHYTGPGWDYGEPPEGELDWGSLYHDLDYQAIGRKSKLYPSRADKIWLRRAKRSNPKTKYGRFVKKAGIAFFTAKQRLPLEELQTVANKRITSRWKQRELSMKKQSPNRNRNRNLVANVNRNLPSNLPFNKMGKRITAPFNSNSTPKRRARGGNAYVKSGRRKKSKTLTKKIQKVLKTNYFEGPWKEFVVIGGQFTSPINLVNWTLIDAATSKIESMKSLITTDGGPAYVGLDSTNAVPRIETPFKTATPGQLALLGTAGNIFKLKRKYIYNMRNNSNFPATFQIYIVKVLQYTAQTLVQELNDVYQGQIKDSTTDDYAKDPFQYFSVPGVSKSQRKYEIHSRQDYHLEGGESINCTVDLPWVTYNPDVVDKMAVDDNTHIPNSYQCWIRQTGVPAHDDAISTSTGLSNSTIDYITKRFTSIMVKKGLAARQQSMDSRAGFALATPVVGDPEAVGVGVLVD